MRKGILVVLLALIAVSLFLAVGVGTVQAQTCGLPGLPKCPKTPTPQSTPRPIPRSTPTTPQPTPQQSPRKPPLPKMASLSIYSMPGSTVMLNGKSTGQVGSDGSFYISSLKPARYAVKISLNGYQIAIRTVILKAGSGESLQMPLVAFPGTLNVTTNVQGTTIEIDGLGTYSNKVSSLSLDAGNYQITASKTGYRRATQNEYIAPGQTKNIQIFLKPINVQELLAEANTSYDARDFQKAIALCNEVLTIEPENARAHFCIGLSFYVLKQYDRSFDYFVQAISMGETLGLTFGRRKRLGPFDETLEFGTIELTQTTIAFYNKKVLKVEDMSGTGQADFKVPYSKITELVMENEGFNGSWRLATKVLLPNKKGKEHKEDFHFYNSSAVVVAVPSTNNKVQYSKIMCKDCQAEIQFIYKLITKFRDESRASNAN